MDRSTQETFGPLIDVRLAEIEAELAAVGRCAKCDGDIAVERLQHQPTAVMCMPCLVALTPKKGR